MKKISAVMTIGILLALANNQAFSQYQTKMKFIEPYHLGITYFKTSNLIFPYAIVSVDRGSKDVLVQQAKGVENILHLKAGKEDFEETNLTVITADGHLYSYILHYTDSPSPLNIQFTSQKLQDPEALFSAGFTNEAELKADAERIVGKIRTVRGIKDKKHGIQLTLNGLYIRDNIMCFQIKLENSSNITYDIGQLRFFISDQKKSKRTASQELEVKPLYVHHDTTTVVGQNDHTFVFALPKFTISDKKHLIIQVMEKSGGRHLELKVNNRAIVRSKSIGDKR
jgi:conjugative transposon TraN protein